jgi:hypothetical protein
MAVGYLFSCRRSSSHSQFCEENYHAVAPCTVATGDPLRLMSIGLIKKMKHLDGASSAPHKISAPNMESLFSQNE